MPSPRGPRRGPSQRQRDEQAARQESEARRERQRRETETLRSAERQLQVAKGRPPTEEDKANAAKRAESVRQAHERQAHEQSDALKARQLQEAADARHQAQLKARYPDR